MDEEKMRVFAYGSNMDVHQMLSRCPSASYVGVGLLKNFRLTFGGWSEKWGGGVATIVHATGRVVPGAIYRVNADDLAILDMYEGFPFVYGRRVVGVKTKLGTKLPCFVYQLARHNPAAGVAPGVGYLRLIAAAYRFWGLKRYAGALYDAVRRCRHVTPPSPIRSVASGVSVFTRTPMTAKTSSTLPSRQLPLRPPLAIVKEGAK